MVRTILAAVLVAGIPTLAGAEGSASAPLLVTATVVSSCNVEVPQSTEPSSAATFPVTVTCGRGNAMPRIQRPVITPAPRRSEDRDAVLLINF